MAFFLKEELHFKVQGYCFLHNIYEPNNIVNLAWDPNGQFPHRFSVRDSKILHHNAKFKDHGHNFVIYCVLVQQPYCNLYL